MKKEELLEIGLTEEQVSKVFAMNGADIEREKAKTIQAKADLADAQAQLAARDKDLEALQKSAAGAEDVQKQLADLQNKYNTETEQYKAQIAARDYADAIARGISNRNIKFTSKGAETAFVAALKEKKLELKDGELTGMDDFVKSQREADPDAFAPDKPAARIVGPMGNNGAPATGPSRAAQIAAEHNRSLYGEIKKE